MRLDYAAALSGILSATFGHRHISGRMKWFGGLRTPDNSDGHGRHTRGKWWHTNGHALCAGEATSTEIPRSSLTSDRLRTDVLRYLKGAKQAVACRPVVYQMFGRYGGVWFDTGQPINSQYYSHVMRLFPDAKWSVAGFAFFASSKGRTVASVMQFKADVNETVSELMTATNALS